MLASISFIAWDKVNAEVMITKKEVTALLSKFQNLKICQFSVSHDLNYK